MDFKPIKLKGNVIHDFPYPKRGRKCPHLGLISLTPSGSCIYQCPMCYARAYPWSVQEFFVYENLPQKFEAEIREARILPSFYLSQITDPLQPVKEVRELTYAIIRIILKYRLSFHITTKSADGSIELLRVIPELKEYPYWFIAMSVESPPGKELVTSPGASTIKERLYAMEELNKLGVTLVGRIDPIILGFVETSEIIWLVNELAAIGVKHIITSTGHYNRLSMTRLLKSIGESKWRKLKARVAQIYGFSDNPNKKKFRAPWKKRVEFHTFLRKEVEKLGMTYAVCLELPKEYDSPGLPSCEGVNNIFLYVKREDGKFYPICYGDCIRSCPDVKNPPCGNKSMQDEYPYKAKTLGIRKRGQSRHSERSEESLF